jgi:phage terminase large subunit
VFANRYAIEPFQPGPDWDGPYQGGDFGFAQDPTAAVRVWVHDQCLWIEHEAHKVGLELDDTAQHMCDHIPDFARYVTRWDSARPESISFLKRHGLPLTEAVKKWPGSVQDGIGFLRSFRRIVVHPRCREVTREFRLYSYKTDRQTGDILPTIIDAHNHCIDAVRYAIGPMIRRKGQPRVRVL